MLSKILLASTAVFAGIAMQGCGKDCDDADYSLTAPTDDEKATQEACTKCGDDSLLAGGKCDATDTGDEAKCKGKTAADADCAACIEEVCGKPTLATAAACTDAERTAAREDATAGKCAAPAVDADAANNVEAVPAGACNGEADETKDECKKCVDDNCSA